MDKEIFNNKRILITGGSGSWGQELTTQLLEKYSPKEIRIYSRGEPKQVLMRRTFNNDIRLKFVIGDVRDYERLEEVSNVDYIFHLSALKHIPVCEENVSEAIKTNILGTKNVIKSAIKNNVKKVILISTDKAVEPLNLYGLSKAIAEKLVISANHLTDKTSFVCIRAGNVLGTSESVIPVFRKQILKDNQITITDGSMTRFLLNIKQAISLIFKASTDSVGGEIFVMDMPSVKLDNLADVMIKGLGNEKTKKSIIGIREGEKMHELLVSNDESGRSFKVGEYFLILPINKTKRLKDKYDVSSLEKVSFDRFSSFDNNRLNNKEIKKVLDNEGWLDKR